MKRAITSSTPFSSGNAPPDKPVPAPRATTGDLPLMAESKHALHLVDVARQHHQHGRGAVSGESVAFVRFELFLLMQDFQIRPLRVQGLQQGSFVDVRQDAVDAFIVKNVHSRLTTLSCFYRRSVSVYH